MAWAHLRDFGVSRSPPEDFRRVSYVDEEARRGRAAERVAQQVITGERHLHQRWLTRIWNKAWKELGSELRNKGLSSRIVIPGSYLAMNRLSTKQTSFQVQINFYFFNE